MEQLQLGIQALKAGNLDIAENIFKPFFLRILLRFISHFLMIRSQKVIFMTVFLN